MSRTAFRAGRDQASLSENMELLTGQRGDGSSRAVTYKDLAKLGVLTLRRGAGGKVVPEIVKPGDKDNSVSRPTKPQNVKATGGFGSILVTWDNPTYSGHAYAEVFRHTENAISEATLIATVNANVFGDIVPLGSKFFYWVRFVNINNTEGAHSNAVYAETSQNISEVIDEIGDQMRESELIQELNSGISLMDEALSKEIEERLTDAARLREDISVISIASGNNTSEIRETKRLVSDVNISLSQQINTVQSELGETKSAVQNSSQAIATINEDGSSAHKAMWATKAQAGQITAGIGIIAKSDGTSQVAVSASQFFVFDPNNPNGTITPTFAIDKGRVVIPKALIENATIQILQAQEITADFVRAGIEMSSPKINAGQVRGGDAGFGAGGPYDGYRTFVHSNGLIQTNNLHAEGGHIKNMRVQNAVIDEDCEIRGKLTVNQIEGGINTTLVKKYLNRSSTSVVNKWVWIDVLEINVQNERPYDRQLEISNVSYGPSVFVVHYSSPSGSATSTWRLEWQWISKSTGKVHRTIPVIRTFGGVGSTPPYYIDLTPPSIGTITIPAHSDELDYTLRIRSITGDVDYIKVNYDHNGNYLGKEYIANLTLNNLGELS